MEFKINIGINNNTKTFDELWRYLADKQGYYLIEFSEQNGEYNGIAEPTLVARLRTDYVRLSKVVSDIENICSVLNQDCIAIQGDSFELLVYGVSFKGERQKFNNKYFL
jgi:hypothetical protein